MKILEIIPDLSKRAGAEVFFDSLCKELSKDESLEIVVVIIWNKIDDSFAELKSNPKIKFYCCGKKKKGINVNVIKTFKHILISEKPDIVHTHRSVLLTYFMSFGFKRRSWRHVHTVHNVASKEAGHYEIFLRKLFIKRKLLSQIGISKEISKSIISIYKREPIATIYNGITFTPSISTDKKYDFICVARFSKQKNHGFLLTCFAELQKKYPTLNLLLVGDGELRDECKSLCSKLSLNKNVIFYGSTPSVASLLGQSKVFVLGSLYEGNPISILEAMSSGLPIVAPCVGGIPDVISNLENGLLYKVNDKNALISNMERIIKDASLQNNISKNNILKSKEYSMEKCANSYKEVFRAIV